MNNENILEVKDLAISFKQYYGFMRKRQIHVVHDINLSVRTGEVMAIFGESGSGKSLLAHAILDLLPVNARVSGSVLYQGKPLDSNRLRKVRGKEISFIPQTIKSLNPLQKSGKQVALAIHNKHQAKLRQEQLFRNFSLQPEVAEFYPFQLSGGMARKVLVSAAIMNDAKLLIADEPSPGMDQMAVDELVDFFHLVSDKGNSAMIITHDIMMALRLADRIAIFYDGTILEVADKSAFTGKGEQLKHPYSRALWNALPQNGFIRPNIQELKKVEGRQ